jgi:DNA-directed RNA polymerase specialized sigma24 family protein
VQSPGTSDKERERLPTRIEQLRKQDAAIETLSPDHQVVVALRYFHDPEHHPSRAMHALGQ